MRILDAFGPADIADVNQAVETVFDLDEGAEFRDVADFPVTMVPMEYFSA